jgi:hypothetical protein
MVFIFLDIAFLLRPRECLMEDRQVTALLVLEDGRVPYQAMRDRHVDRISRPASSPTGGISRGIREKVGYRVAGASGGLECYGLVITSAV